jgi:hypothetical protein
MNLLAKQYSFPFCKMSEMNSYFNKCIQKQQKLLIRSKNYLNKIKRRSILWILIPNSLQWACKKVPEESCAYLEFAFFANVFAYNFFLNIFWTPFKKFGISITLCNFLFLIMKFSRFFCHISTCIKVTMYMPKGKFCKKVKNLIFCKYLI